MFRRAAATKLMRVRTLFLAALIATAVTACSTPAVPPTGLTATAGLRAVQLNWTGSTDTMAHYDVLQGPNASSLTKVAELPAGSTSYTVGGLAGFETYHFAVQAVNTKGGKARTAAVSATPYQRGFPDGQFVIFEGDHASYLETSSSSALNPLTAFTIEGRLLLFGAAIGPACTSFVGRGFVSAYWVGVCGGELRSYTRGEASRYTAGVIPTGEWAHFAVTTDGTTTSHYLNGELVGSAPAGGPPTANTKRVRMGSDVDYAYAPVAALDELRLWGVARTEAEIAANMAVTLTGEQPGLVATWSLDHDGREPIGQHLADVTGTLGFGVGATITESDPTFPVIYIDAVAGTCDSQGSTPVPYKVHEFYVEAGGVYTLSVRDGKAAVEASLYVFNGAFDVADPLSNCVAAMNRGDGVKVATATLPAGGPHSVVVFDDRFTREDPIDYIVSLNGPF